MSAITVEPNRVVVFTDVVCAWSSVAINRFLTARDKLGLTDVHLEHRLFLLEDVNQFPLPKRFLDSELPVVSGLAPELDWQNWAGDPANWPVTTLLANEAVHAAKRQSPEAAEELDMALRQAIFSDSKCISLLHVILEVAGNCKSVDADALLQALDSGVAREQMMADYRHHRDKAQGSAHFFFPDGTDEYNPGVTFHWSGSEEGKGFPVIDNDNPNIFEELLAAKFR